METPIHHEPEQDQDSVLRSITQESLGIQPKTQDDPMGISWIVGDFKQWCLDHWGYPQVQRSAKNREWKTLYELFLESPRLLKNEKIDLELRSKRNTALKMLDDYRTNLLNTLDDFYKPGKSPAEKTIAKQQSRVQDSHAFYSMVSQAKGEQSIPILKHIFRYREKIQTAYEVEDPKLLDAITQA
jgi:hypothetical protein